jgi:hypothetical protein
MVVGPMQEWPMPDRPIQPRPDDCEDDHHLPPTYVDDRDFVSIKETMRLTDLGRTTIYGLLKSGRLEGRKIGHRHIIVRRSISKLGLGR